MGKTKISLPEKIVERNIELTGEIMRYLLDQPHLFNSLPDNFELVILPDDDPEIRLYNLELLDKYGGAGKPVVFARIKSHQENKTTQGKPSLFVPIAV